MYTLQLMAAGHVQKLLDYSAGTAGSLPRTFCLDVFILDTEGQLDDEFL